MSSFSVHSFLFFLLDNCRYFGEPILALLAFDVPFREQRLDQIDESLGFIGIDFDDQIHILFKVRSNVAERSHMIDGVDTFGGHACRSAPFIDRGPKCLDLSVKRTFRNFAEIANYSLQASARERGARFGALAGR